MEQIDIDINVNTNNADEIDEITAKLNEATNEAQNLEGELDNVNIGDVGADAVAEELSEATTEADSLQTSLDEIGNTTITPEVNIDNSGLDETNEKLQEVENTSSSLTTALGGLAGVIGVDQMISTADRINTSWNQLKLTFDGTGVSLDELKAKTDQAAAATGQSGSTIRGYFNQMGIAGIQNTNLLTSSFESISAKSYQTGQSIESMESKVQKMVMTGNASSRMLTSLGITTEDLGNAMGVTGDQAKAAFESLDQEGRLEALTTAMGDGAQANEMYKNSYAGLKAQAEAAMAGLMGAVGEGALPIINPLIQAATSVVKGLTGAFKALPGPIQGVVGSFGGFVAVGATTVGTLGLLGQVGSKVADGLNSLKSGYDTVRGAMSAAKGAIDTLRNAESLTAGVRAVLSGATTAEAAAETAGAAAKTAATGPTTGLAIAENALLWPILLVTAAIVALVAGLYYLYNSNETVRNSVDWLVSAVTGFANSLIPTAMGVINFATKVISSFGKLPGAINTALQYAIIQVGIWAVSMVQKGVNAAHNFVNSVKTALSGIGSAVSGALSGVYNFLTAPFRQAYNFINNNVIQPLKDAWGWLSGAFSGFEGFEGYEGLDETLNSTIANIQNNQNESNAVAVTNNFNGLIEESAADYIVGAVNDRLRKEKLLSGG